MNTVLALYITSWGKVGFISLDEFLSPKIHGKLQNGDTFGELFVTETRLRVSSMVIRGHPNTFN